MLLNDPRGFGCGDLGIFDAQVVGMGDLAGVAFTAVVFVVTDEPGIGIFNAPLGGLVLQAVFRDIALEADLLGGDQLHIVHILLGEAEALGADAVIGVTYGSSAVMQGAAEVIAYGTAVKFK